jgi:hypothetical protein
MNTPNQAAAHRFNALPDFALDPLNSMNTEAPIKPGGSSSMEMRRLTFSKIIRRLHMYLALFLAPWMLMYALSTLAMANREFVQTFYATKTPALTIEREMNYSRTFIAGATPEQMGQQILEDLSFNGAHRVSGGTDGKPLVIERLSPLAQRRITFDPATRQVSVQREEFRCPTFLERMHTRRGYQHPYAWADSWALSVDVTACAIVFWGLSGLWMWWELRPTRLLGGLCFALGLALFGTFLAMI